MYFLKGELYDKNNHLATLEAREMKMGRSGIEPPTHGFSVRCSTN
jgi:hypothetical protein